MNLNLVALTSLVVLFFFHHAIAASSVFKTIQEDKDLCPSSADILKSKYLNKCNNVTYPVNMNVNWTSSNKDMFLCMAIYDRSFQICLTGTKLKLGSSKESILTNKTLFDNEMNKTITELKNISIANDHALSICKSSMLYSPDRIHYNKTKLFVKKLENATACVLSCFDSSTLSSLCIAIDIIDKKIIEMNKELVNVPETRSTNYDNVDQQNNNDQMPLLSSLEDPQTGDDYKLQEDKKDKKNNNNNPSASMVVNDTTGKSQKIKNNSTSQKAEPSMKSNETSIKAQSPIQDKPTLEVNTISDFIQDTGNNDSNPDVIQPENNADDILEHSDFDNEPVVGAEETQNKQKPSSQKESLLIPSKVPVEDDSNFFGYLTVIGILCIGGCVVYHHKQKILAIILEGRRSRGGRGRRRHSANYRKLDCTLEEAVNSQCDSNTTNVIY